MMSLAKARLHSVFPLERIGDTLVVTPQGDAIGFSSAQIQVELQALERMLERPASWNLIVDLEHTNYFGSEMIGHINRMGVKARSSGGRIAMCNASGDMRDILHVMKLNQMWQMFESRREALSAIASVPVGERLWAARKWMAGLATVIAVTLAIAYFPWPSRHKDYYERFMSYSNELRELRSEGRRNEGQRNGFRKKVERDLEPILRELSKQSMEGDPAAAYLYVAGRNCLLPMFNANGPAREQLERDFAENMSRAAIYIEGVDPPDVAIVADSLTKNETPKPSRTRVSRRSSSSRER